MNIAVRFSWYSGCCGRKSSGYYHKQAQIPELVVIETGVNGVLLHASDMDDLPAILKLQEAGKPVVAMAMHSRIKTIAGFTENYEE